MSKNARVREETGPKRVSLDDQKRDILGVPEKKGFHRCWVNDTDQGQNIASYLRAGYRIVEEADVVAGDGDHIDFPDQKMGSGLRKYVGAGMTAVLMEIEQEYFDADQAAKAERANKKERAIFRGEGVDGIDGNTRVEDREGVGKYTRRS